MNGTGDISLSEVSEVQKAKSACYLSYVEYRHNTKTQYYEKQMTVRGGHIQDEESKRRKLR
jgi:hypothetical protein